MLNIKKVSALPETLVPNTLYLVADGANDLVVVLSSADGSISHRTKTSVEVLNTIQGVIDALPKAWKTEEVARGANWGDTIYMKQTHNTLWRIKRIGTDGIVMYSNSYDAGQVSTLAAAWTDRATLNYTTETS